jgi:hypothetical protein
MARRVWCVWGPLVLAACGCVPDEELTTVPSGGPLARSTSLAPPDLYHLPHAPATEAVAARVGEVGRKVLTANHELKQQPVFFTLGVEHEELFHQGDGQVYITEGLARKCKTEGQLAALLCMELGRMAVERERLASPAARQAASRPPADVPVGGDYRTSFGGPDQTRLMELYKYDSQKRKPDEPPLPRPEAVARAYLIRAGYSDQDLAAAAPLLRDAEDHVALEKQLTGK